MISSPIDCQYSFRHASLVAIVRSLHRVLASLEDTRATLISSTNPALLATLYPGLSAAVELEDESRPLQGYLWLRAENSSAYGLSSSPSSDAGALPYLLNSLEHSPDIFLDNSRQSDQNLPCVLVMGLGDRLNILLRASVEAADWDEAIAPRANPSYSDLTYNVELVFEPAIITAYCQLLSQQLTSTSVNFAQAIAGWTAQPITASLQSQLTLQLLTALEETASEIEKPKAVKAATNTGPELTSYPPDHHSHKMVVELGNPDQQWLQQQRLLHELILTCSVTQGPQVILRRAAETIRLIFGVSRCCIAFYGNRDHRVVWGAIARAPELLVQDQQTAYPEWEIVEQMMQKHLGSSTWVTDEPLSRTAKIQAPQISTLSSWTQATLQQGKSWIGGLLSVEQWEQQRTWQPGEMYLLHMAIHQIEQAIYQALLYQQAEERIQRTALLNQITAQIRASLELSQIFETVTTQLGQLVVIDQCAIFQYLENSQVWQAVTEYRTYPELLVGSKMQIPDRDNPFSAQLRNLEIVQVSDTRTIRDPVNQALAEKYPGGWLMVPIHYNQKLWGCLSFNQDGCPRYWHESELEFLRTVADQLAIAIYQATLYQQIQQQNQTLEAQVIQRTAELRSFLDAQPDYIVILEREDLRVRFCNYLLSQTIGVESQQQAQGKSIFEIFAAETAQRFVDRVNRVLQEDSILRSEETSLLPDGIHHFDTFTVPLRKPDGEIYALLCTSRDITELIETKQALSERTDQLQDALTAAQVAAQAKSEFLSTISHELRTPLTSVIGMSSALLKQFFGSLNLKQQEYLQIIHDSGSHLLQIINDMLELVEIETGKAALQVSQFSLTTMAEQTLALLQKKFHPQQIHLHTDLRKLAEQDLFFGDERRIKQILLNLLSNAVKFTPPGGQVWLRIQPNQQAVVIEVEDTGIGIPANRQHLLFKSFQQVDGSVNRQHDGTGLGLALTQQLVEMHDGTISFKSTEGVGTIFTVYLHSQDPKTTSLPASIDE